MSIAEFLKTNGLLADRIRLAIMATLSASREAVDFTTLVTSLGVTRGNLSTHIQKLEEAGLVKVKKEFVGKKPRTSYFCTDKGLGEVRSYLQQVETLLASARK